jgi:hypothetical protein
LPDSIAANIGDISDVVEQAERLQDGGIDADTDIGIPSFDPLQSGTGRESALGDDSHGQPAAAAGVTDVHPQLAQGAAYSGGRMVRCWHFDVFARLLSMFV